LSKKIQQIQKTQIISEFETQQESFGRRNSLGNKFTFEPMTHATLVNMNHNGGHEITPNKDRWVTYQSLDFVVCLFCGPLGPFQPLCGTTECALYFITTYKWPDGKKWSILKPSSGYTNGFLAMIEDLRVTLHLNHVEE
jgi:hypothetical protein